MSKGAAEDLHAGQHIAPFHTMGLSTILCPMIDKVNGAINPQQLEFHILCTKFRWPQSAPCNKVVTNSAAKSQCRTGVPN